jgi:hypothetical protein
MDFREETITFRPTRPQLRLLSRIAEGWQALFGEWADPTCLLERAGEVQAFQERTLQHCAQAGWVEPEHPAPTQGAQRVRWRLTPEGERIVRKGRRQTPQDTP